ncbi:small protein A [Buchnera aphidicola str. Ak (Acyrthosiphon kondoi)]|uniref:Outer membrane protein assembly factor BamE n=1 Tax=Buchnera aphidicola str. Ak (Acyrthosiphon kondoi) TaxID=1005090 RepID=G2LMQ6_9GAMM|nr:outer membrane protein assembly factor BamE [Buchnera aphidicola]AEO08544.1 small protein A [Buchnera aphidicola str. Ak (Acyrthosiphon kondoi)]WAI18104.1 MAG: outer membrane protein assembly factor BamE [Buchnera aphidicola (Acyrthosiphon caraganae)]
MNNYVKMLLIVIFFSSCSILDNKKYDSNFLEGINLNHNVLNKNYIGMTRQQIVYIFGMPIISDSFNDVYHYYVNNPKNNNVFQKKMLNFYFKDNKVLKFNFT